MEQLYYRKNSRYHKIGYSDGWQGFPTDGIWLVQNKDGCKSSECIIELGDLESIQPAAGLILKYKDKIMDYLESVEDKCSIYNISLNDFVLDMLKEITKDENS